ncbi:MAG TPA: DMT family transporter [Burkholderiaceae bacterium]
MFAAPLVSGILFALAAGLMWGLVFVGPLLLPEYPAALQSFGRYLAFGLIALPLAWFDRAKLKELSRADWIEALKLALVGNIVYYLFLASSIQRAGGPLPTMIIGTLPVVIAVTANLRRAAPGARVETPLAWSRLAPSLVLIALGIACVNQVELEQLRRDPGADLARYALGALLAACAVACWTWYPLRNAEWLRAHPDRSPRGWATAQGLATLPLALIGYGLTWAWFGLSGATGAAASPPVFTMPFGPRPAEFLLLMFAIGLFASWLGTLCWNEASQRLPPTLSGQLIVFETLAALTYAYALRHSFPQVQTLVGIALLIGGVVWAVRSGPSDESADAHPN